MAITATLSVNPSTLQMPDADSVTVVCTITNEGADTVYIRPLKVWVASPNAASANLGQPSGPWPKTLPAGQSITVNWGVAFFEAGTYSLAAYVADVYEAVSASPAPVSVTVAAQAFWEPGLGPWRDDVSLSEATAQGTTTKKTIAAWTANTVNGTYADGYPVTATGSLTARTLADRFADVVNVKDFGALGDGIIDDTAAIQAAVDYALENKIAIVSVPNGTYLVSDTIHLGYGIGYSTVRLEGTTNYSGMGGTVIKAAFKDRPIINIQGGRNSGLRGIWVDGIDTITTPWGVSLAYAADAANYVYAGSKTDTRAPYCAICIDGYGGTTPPNPYPRPPYPAFYGASIPAVGSEYGRSTSSNTIVEDCTTYRTLIGVCCQPNCDSSGDFLKLRNCNFTLHQVGVSFGNVNARCTDFSNCNFAICHTMIDSVTYRSGTVSNRGNFAGNLSNVHANQCWQILNVSLDWAVPAAFTNFYSENMARVGILAGTKGQVTFIGGSMHLMDTKFSGTTITETYSTPIVDAPSGACVEFVGCNLDLARSVFVFNGPVTFRNCRFTPWTFYGDAYYRDAREQAALEKMLLGLAIPPDLVNVTLTDTISNCRMMGDASSGQANQDGVDIALQSGGMLAKAVGVNGFVPYIATAMHNAHQPGASFLPEASRVLANGGFTIQTTDTFFDPGDLIYLGTARTWFYLDTITDLGGGTYEHQWNALGNYTYTPGDGYTMLNGIAGSAYYYPIGRYETRATANRAFKTTAGSADVEYVDGSGVSVNVGSTFTDRRKLLWRGANSLNLVLPLLPFKTANTKINSISGSTITMSSTAQITAWWLDAPGIALLKLGA